LGCSRKPEFSYSGIYSLPGHADRKGSLKTVALDGEGRKTFYAWGPDGENTQATGD